MSPSPRKAWIETVVIMVLLSVNQRRLPPGRRGLKLFGYCLGRGNSMSPSPRKAWIETGLTWNVALETGGVLVGDEVTIDIEVELIRQEDQPAPTEAAAAS